MKNHENQLHMENDAVHLNNLVQKTSKEVNIYVIKFQRHTL